MIPSMVVDVVTFSNTFFWVMFTSPNVLCLATARAIAFSISDNVVLVVLVDDVELVVEVVEVEAEVVVDF